MNGLLDCWIYCCMAGHNILLWGTTNPNFPLKESKAAALVATLILQGVHAIRFDLRKFFVFS